MQNNKFNKKYDFKATLQEQTKNSCSVSKIHKWIFDGVYGGVA